MISRSGGLYLDTKGNSKIEQEQWIKTRNKLILQFIDIEKKHLKDDGTSDISDHKIVDELVGTIKSKVGELS